MTRSGATAWIERKRIGRAAMALGATILLAGAAHAQDAPEAEDDAPPPPPAHLEACGAARCLTTDLTPDLRAALAAGEATLDQLAAGLTLTYAGQEPVRVYLTVARYADDRLVRYDVSEAITVAPGQVSFPDIATVLANALGPRTETGLTLADIDPAVSAANPELPAAGFVGSMPANTLMGMVRPDLTEPLDAAQREALDDVAVIGMITRDAALRENLESKTVGAALRLNYTR